MYRGRANNTREQRSEMCRQSRKDAMRGVNAQEFVGTHKVADIISKLGGTTDAQRFVLKYLGIAATIRRCFLCAQLSVLLPPP